MIDFSDFKGSESALRFFEEISKIPHGSGNRDAIASYLVNFANARSLSVIRDGADNVIIKKPATAGYEKRPTVILQGHTDMVAEKYPGLDKDMEKDGLDLRRDGDVLYAYGTTLGGDDGIAVAYALAILDSNDIEHPAIEAVFTSDEEIGLIGASKLDTSVLEGKILINVDSEEEGIFTVGCAGGARCDFAFSLKSAPDSSLAYTLCVFGLKGGHSGVEINSGRENAIKLGIEALKALGDVRIISLSGGNMDNAIPRAFEVSFTSESDPTENFEKISAQILERISKNEPDASFTLTKSESAGVSLDSASTNAVIGAISDIPSGVIKMSKDIPTLPESSENLGIVRMNESALSLTVSVRSSKSEGKASLIANLTEIAKKYGARFSTRGDYPAWEYKSDSRLRDLCCEIYREKYKKEPTVLIIHAGLECGLFSNSIEGLDCVSIGPNMANIHTTEEKLSLSSADRVFDFIKEVLKRI